MKIKLIFYTFLFVCISTALTAQKFTAVSGNATDIAISPKDGTVYTVGKSKNVFQYNAKQRKFTQIGSDKSNAVEVTADAKGKVFMLNTSGQRNILTKGKKSWKKLTSEYLLTLAVDKQSKSWALAKSGNKLQYFDIRTWKALSKTPRVIKRIAPYSSNLCYIVKTDKTIHQFANGKWAKMPGKAIDITLDLANGDVYIVDTSKRISKWNKKAKKWEALKKSRRDFSRIAVHNGIIWGVTSKKKVYRYQSAPSKDKAITRTRIGALDEGISEEGGGSSRNNYSKPTDYTGTYRFMFTKLLFHAPNKNFNQDIEVYGAAGIYLVAESTSGNIDIKPLNNRKNRTLDLLRANPIKVFNTYKSGTKSVQVINNGKRTTEFCYEGAYEIDKVRTFRVFGDAANKPLAFDIQTNLRLKQLIGSFDYGWQRHRFYVPSVKLGEEQFILIKSSDSNQPDLILGYIITKH